MHARATPLPPVDPADPIWTVEHLAAALRLRERATRELIAAPHFPAGFRLSQAPTARRYWLREDVLTHFASLSGARRPRPVSARRATPPTQGRPADRDADALAVLASLPTRRAGAR